MGFWKVAVDFTIGDSCFLLANFTGGTYFRIGLKANDKGNYYLALFNPAWKTLRRGQEHVLQFKFGELTPWDVPTQVVNLNGLTVLMANFEDTNFWSEFVRQPSLAITRNGKHVSRLSLDGTAQAFTEMLACQRAYNLPKSSVPFAK